MSQLTDSVAELAESTLAATARTPRLEPCAARSRVWRKPASWTRGPDAHSRTLRRENAGARCRCSAVHTTDPELVAQNSIAALSAWAASG